MHPRILFFFLLFSAGSSAQTPPAAVPAPAQRYLDILVKRPQPGTIFERFYSAWLEESSPAELGAFLEARTKQSGATAADQLLLAVFHSHRGDDRAALAAYEAALKLDAANASAWIERARLESRAFDFAAALQSLDAAAKAQPDEAGTLEIGKLRGRALLRLGRNNEALRTWWKLAADHAEDEGLSEEVIDLLTDEGQYEAALAAARTLLKRSQDPVVHTLRQLRLADILLLAERRDEALKTLRETLAATGTDSWMEGDVLGRISRMHRMSDDVAGLEKFLAGLVKEHPQRVALAWQHTQLLGETGQQEAALKQARALLRSNPGRRDLQEGFLDLLESLDLIKESAAQALARSQQNATDKELLVRLAGLQHRAKDDAAAQATLERFLALGNTEADHLRVARLLENWEEPPVAADSLAARAYTRLAESFPASISAQEAQAHYLHRSGRRDAALAIWTRLAKSATLEDLLRIAQALQARQESRTALDLLAPREADFANEPRFFALLVQLGIACKEVERTLPWARTRLSMAQDAETIEAAVKDTLLVLRSGEAGKLSASLLQELQKEKTLSLQSRCLLAALLENGGKGAEAEKVLNDAPAAGKAVALSQLAQLYQTRQAWEKAAQTLQQVIEFPGQRTTARVQRVVDWYRRAEKPEQALMWIAEWKKLSPSAVQPWLDESRLLTDLDRGKEALALLRAAVRKFPDNVEAASSYASRCLENGQADEAERTYLALYEKTTDAAARLRLIGPLAQAAQQQGTLPRLVENFRQRQQQNRASAQPWLALAELYRATGNDEERRRCLYEASRLRPQDLGLLLDIARSEEEIGLTKEALRTLESAARLDKTSKTRENIIRLQIESGDADLGYRMLFELAGGSQMDARAIEQMADTIAEKGEWERVIAFLEPLLDKHPKDYRLHYLNAVALEEAGREKEAVGAFIEITSMHEELPGVLSTGRSIGLRRQYDTLRLPPGTEDWLVLPAMAQAAYAHRQKQNGGGYHPRSTPAPNGLPGNGFVQQAPGVTESPVLALVHVLQMISMWDAPEREPALRSLKQAGFSNAPLLLTAAENSPLLVITPEMLMEQPQNAALHAAWLMQNRSGDPAVLLPVCEHIFKLFESSHPALALRTASLAWRIAEDQSPAWTRRILDICQGMPTGDTFELQILISMLRSQSDLFPQQTQGMDVVKLSPDEIRAITSVLQRWISVADERQSYYVAEVIYAFAAVKSWEGMVEIIRHRLGQRDKPQGQSLAVATIPPPPPPARGRSHRVELQPSPLPMTSVMFKLPAEDLVWISRISPQRESEEASPNEEFARWKKEFHDGLQPLIENAGEPGLKLILRLMTGDQQSMLDELAPRLAASPTLDDLLLAGWLCQQMNQSGKALAFFQQAQVLVSDVKVRQELDLAMLYHALTLQKKADNVEFKRLTSIVKPVVERLAQAAVTPEEKFQVSRIMNSLGLQEQAQKTGRSARASSSAPVSPHAAVIINPYSRNYSHRQQQTKRVSIDDLLKRGDKTAAAQELTKQLRAAIQSCLNPQGSAHSHYQVRTVIRLFEQYKLADEVMQAMRAAAGSSWKAQQEYAVLLENTGTETRPAIEAHRAVTAANPRAFASHERLASLLATEGDFPAALQHWNTLPAATQALYLPALIHELSERSEISAPRPAALSGLLSAWLRSLPASRPLPVTIAQQFSQALNNIQASDPGQNLSFPSLWEPYSREQSRNGHTWSFNEDGTLKLSPESQKARDIRRAAHDQLCQAMMLRPELALPGFAPVAGLALFENSRLEETEKTALDLLSQRAMPQVKRRLMAQGYDQQSHAGLNLSAVSFGTPDRIAMLTPAVFATYSAALRGDQRLLDEAVFPAILKAEGKSMAEYCRAYAAMLTADEAHFVSAAAAWLQPPGKRSSLLRSQQEGGPLEEIVRLWQKRKLHVSLDPLFLSPEPGKASVDAGHMPEAVHTYVSVLEQRDPEALRSFVRRMRDQMIGATPESRAQNIAVWLESQSRKANGRRTGQTTRAQQAVQNYTQWLQRLLLPPHSLALFDLAAEDGLDLSPEWLRPISSDEVERVRSSTPEDFVSSAGLLGFLNEASSFRAREVFKPGHQITHIPWLSNFVFWYRAQLDAEAINATLAHLGRQKPTLGAHILQALLVKDFSTPLQIDGKSVPFDSAVVARYHTSQIVGSEFISAALETVLRHHSKELATMTDTGRRELSAVLRFQLNGYPQPERLGEEFTQVLAPLLKTEHSEVIRQVDAVLASKTWGDIPRKEYDFARQFPVLLRDLALVDSAKTQAAARHAAALLRTSPGQTGALLRDNPITPEIMFLQELGKTPQLAGITIALAAEAGLKKNPLWSYGIFSHADEALRNPIQAKAIFTGTPWVADTAGFRDVQSGDRVRPTLIATLVERIESDRLLLTLLLDHLSRQPATFGTKLCQAFLTSGPKPGSYTHSFYIDRPDDTPLVAFMREHGADFSRLQPDTAAMLFTLLTARMPDLRRKMQQDPVLQKALLPLDEAEAREFESELNRWLSASSLSELYKDTNQVHEQGPPLLDRVASTDKPLAVRLLDHVSMLIAQHDAQNNRGGRQPQHQTPVAGWLRCVTGVPELFGEIMRRAEECGAAKNPEWLQNMLSNAGNLYPFRHEPQRALALFESAGLLNSAATFTPHPVPGNPLDSTMLEAIGRQMESNRPGNARIIEALEKRRPRTFGGDMLLLLGSRPSREDIASFAKAYADEIAAAPAAQKKMLAALFEQKQWMEIMAPLVPALHEQFAPGMPQK